ncbi:MAG: ClpXP protease specificity-enhancing factor SspB [Flavimaricola sp.]|nr:ClpXP protease specificity-enhancing factor SspB [Flavimaricola sp.]
MTRSIDYGNLMHRAMRGLIQEVLVGVAKSGLPGKHHFFITFDTMHPDVEIADWLSDRYPGEMTIVLQHWFDGLEVTDEGFAVTLNFGDNPEPLYIPYDAIKTFVDPSVEFGLRFETQEDETEDDDEVEEAPMDEMAEPAPTKTKSEKAQVVSLDSFRK